MGSMTTVQKYVTSGKGVLVFQTPIECEEISRTSFSDWNDVNDFLKEYSAETFQVFAVSDSKTVKAYNKRRVNHLNDSLGDYAYITYKCTHGFARRSRGIGKRPGQHYRFTGCKAGMRFLNTGSEIRLCYSNVIHNHSIGEEVYSMYPQNRAIKEPTVLSFIESNIGNGMDKGSIFKSISNVSGKTVKMKDIYNATRNL